MLEKAFKATYNNFRLNFYKNVFQNLSDHDLSLTATEIFCLEVTQLLNKPTINELGEFLKISQPNTAYKVNNLVKKGYLTKTQSSKDRREYILNVTDKFNAYQNMKNDYIHTVLERVKNKFSKVDIDLFTRILNTMSEELMPEVSTLAKNR